MGGYRIGREGWEGKVGTGREEWEGRDGMGSEGWERNMIYMNVRENMNKILIKFYEN